LREEEGRGGVMVGYRAMEMVPSTVGFSRCNEGKRMVKGR